MKLFLAGLTLAGSLALAAAEVQKGDPFDYVCEQVSAVYETSGICSGLEPPEVILSEVLNLNSWTRLNGVYLRGEKYIFVSPTSTNVQRTIEHEMTHYILDTLSLVGETDVCEHERVARFVSGQPWTDRQKEQYGCRDSTSED